MANEKQFISVTTGTMVRAVLVIVGAIFVYTIRDLIGILLISLLLAAAMNPIADYFAKRRIPRTVTVLVVYLIILAVLAILAVAIIPPAIEESRGLIQNFGALWQKMLSNFRDLRALIGSYGLAGSFEQSVTSVSTEVSGWFAGLFSTFSGVVNGVVSFFVILVIAFFLVVEKNSLRDFSSWLLPARYHAYAVDLAPRIQRKISQWVLGEFVLMAFVGGLSYVGFLAFGVKYALLLAVFAGITEVIPYIGPVVGSVPAVFFALSESPTKGILVLILVFLIQRIENMVLVPKVMQKVTGLNPIAAIVSIAIGYTLGGIVGSLLAIPVATALQLVANDYKERQNAEI